MDKFQRDNIKYEKFLDYYIAVGRASTKQEEYNFIDDTIAIGEQLFGSDLVIKKVKIPESLLEIHAGAFAYSSLEEITGSFDSIKYIENSAFMGCKKLKFQKLPNKLKVIDRFAFSGTNDFIEKDIIFPKSIEEIGAYAFTTSRISGHLEIIPEKKPVEIKLSAFRDTKIISAKIRTEKIEADTFSYTPLERIEFESGIKTIDKNAFRECPDLKEIFINATQQEKINFIKNNQEFMAKYSEKIKFSCAMTLEDLLNEGKSISEINAIIKTYEESYDK